MIIITVLLIVLVCYTDLYSRQKFLMVWFIYTTDNTRYFLVINSCFYGKGGQEGVQRERAKEREGRRKKREIIPKATNQRKSLLLS